MIRKPMNRRQHPIPRRGFTLIEVLGTLGILLALGVSAVVILGDITEIGVRTNEDRQGRISIERLAQTFRDDVHHAAEIEISDDQSMRTLATGSTSIHYELQQSPPAVFRRVIESDSKTARDLFPLPSKCRPTVAIDGKHVLLRLNSGQDSQRLVIEASQP